MLVAGDKRRRGLHGVAIHPAQAPRCPQRVHRVGSGAVQVFIAFCTNVCSVQVFVLDSLTSYEPADSREAESIIERVVPRLQHANAAVVLSAVKIVLRFMSFVTR